VELKNENPQRSATPDDAMLQQIEARLMRRAAERNRQKEQEEVAKIQRGEFS
jgi:hypothetical protein